MNQQSSIASNQDPTDAKIPNGDFQANVHRVLVYWNIGAGDKPVLAETKVVMWVHHSMPCIHIIYIRIYIYIFITSRHCWLMVQKPHPKNLTWRSYRRGSHSRTFNIHLKSHRWKIQHKNQIDGRWVWPLAWELVLVGYLTAIHDYYHTSSTAQGGGGSFKNRKRIGEIHCCEWRMSEQKHWPTD